MKLMRFSKTKSAMTGAVVWAALMIMSAHAAAPASQNFDAIPPQESAREDNPSLTLDGVVYSTDATNDALAVDTVANVTGYLPTLGTGNAISSGWYAYTGTFFQFASVDNADDFRLLSLRAEVWGGTANTAEIYTIEGFNNGGLIASATVTFTSSGIYGIGDDAITYTRQTTLQEEEDSGYTANAGLLVFGSNWDNIDQVRFTVADGDKGLAIMMDEIAFTEASGVPEPAHFAAIAGLLALGACAQRRTRR